MDDRLAAALAQAVLSDADARYHQLRDAAFAQQTPAGFLGELWQACRTDPSSFVRAGLDPDMRARADRLGVRVPGFADLPPEGADL